ncbi:MAG: cupin domain-containing protein [Chloroflexota bacterium]
MEIITVRPDHQTATRQNLRNFVGISEKTAGAKGLSLNLVVVPPGGKAEPHYHDGFETAIYVLQGRVETKYGKRLEKSVINVPGDFVFIPADLPHQAINLSDTEEAKAIIARNDPNEQESVVPWKVEE